MKQAVANRGALRSVLEDDALQDISEEGVSDAMPAPATATGKKLHIPARLRNIEPLPWQESESFSSQMKVQSQRATGLFYSVYAHKALLEGDSEVKPLYYCFAHGAGSSALSFAYIVKHLRALHTDAETPVGFVAMDYRGHGDTSLPIAADAQQKDYALDTLCDDFVECTVATLKELHDGLSTDIVLVGHSLGGSIVTSVAHDNRIPDVKAFVVLDVVEGTAMDALHSTSKILQQRPASFFDWSEAIGWALMSKTISNQKSARVSIPALFEQVETDRLVWRHDWHATQEYWQLWFEGLSSKFLSTNRSIGKLLILAGTDRLDKPLMIAQMQGAFQMNVIPGAGHFVHEDEPAKVAMILRSFVDRYCGSDKRLLS
jgi:protein phosphatase methylesterase 1